jgi:hypothetical protein
VASDDAPLAEGEASAETDTEADAEVETASAAKRPSSDIAQ